MPILIKLLEKIAEEGTLPNSFNKAITLIPKPKTTQTKKTTGQYHSMMNTDEKSSTKF